MDAPETKVAIIGMAGRFPGANSVHSFWEDVLHEGRETIMHFDHNDSQSSIPKNGDETPWVEAYGHLENTAWFDHSFFDVSPAEARRMDPQHRLFLECTWEALEDAGIDITTFDGYASVYASSSENEYARQVEADLGSPTALQKYAIGLGNSRDFLATRIGYKLDLKGECLTVQSACSSSLGGVHLACQSILTGQSDLAIAGGVSVGASLTADDRTGYWAGEGFITSPDGHCRPFTEAANGTVPGEGVGIVVLKPLVEAMNDQDRIYGVISGSALNNDGHRKVGYQAPSLDGQVGVIRDALAFSNVAPHEIGYLECHGTGTDIGDAIELRALRKVFETEIAKVMGPLYLGSVKANVGHLDAAAGIAGLIKGTLALHHSVRPPLLHANTNAPHSQLADSDVLAINAEPQPWEAPAGPPRRAGVTSLGIGGTNAHVILEEAPTQHQRDRSDSERPSSLLVWSAKTDSALTSMTNQLATSLEDRQEELDLKAVAHTLQTGRASFDRRRYLVSGNVGAVADALRMRRFEEAPEAFQSSPRKIAFLFPGSGAYYSGMAAELLDVAPAFGDFLTDCANRLPARAADFNLINFLADRENTGLSGKPGLQHRQCAIVSFEYALSRLLMKWGCAPDALIGSSLGEYTAACLSGALSLEDLLTLVWLRGELLNNVTGGGMTLVNASFSEVQDLTSVPDYLEEAIRISETSVAVSGPQEKLETLETELEAHDTRTNRLPPRVAYHSGAVDPVRDELTAAFDTVEFNDPDIPYISNYTGEWIEHDQIHSSSYWFDQMRRTVQLSQGFETLYDDGIRLFLEVGPGHGLSKFVDLNFPDHDDVLAKPCLAHPQRDSFDWSALAEAVGTAWLSGASINWEAFGHPTSTVRLPTYPFERQFFHVREEPPSEVGEAQSDKVAEPTRPSPGGDGQVSDAPTPPRTALEETVADVWTNVLGLEQVGIEQDFFDLGGDSFLALQLREELANTFDVSLSEQAFFEQGTVAGMAREVERQIDGSSTRSDILVQMKEGTDTVPIFLLYPVGGEVFCYRDLVDSLSNDSSEQAVYGIRAPGLVGDDDGPASVNQMAEEFATILTDQFDFEACRIGGWSFGGVVGYELAARLEDAGISVSQLLMIDTEHPDTLREHTSAENFVSFDGFLRDLVGVTSIPQQDINALRAGLQGKNDSQKLRELSEKMEEVRDDDAWNVDLLEKVYSVYRTNAEAYFQYSPEAHSFDGTVTIAEAELEATSWSVPSDLGWSTLLPDDLERVTLPADHYGIIHPPTVEALADLLTS